MTLVKLFLFLLATPAALLAGMILLGARSAIHEIEAFLLGIAVVLLLSAICLIEAIQWAANDIGRKIVANSSRTRVSFPEPAPEPTIFTPTPAPVQHYFEPPPPPVIDVEAEAERLFQHAKSLALRNQTAQARSVLDDILASYPGTRAAEKALRSIANVRA